MTCTIHACLPACTADTDCVHDDDNVQCDTTESECACDTAYTLKDGICAAKGKYNYMLYTRY